MEEGDSTGGTDESSSLTKWIADVRVAMEEEVEGQRRARHLYVIYYSACNRLIKRIVLLLRALMNRMNNGFHCILH